MLTFLKKLAGKLVETGAAAIPVQDRRCAQCGLLKWDTKPDSRRYLCRNFGFITGPATSVCVKWEPRDKGWTHEIARAERVVGYSRVALSVGLPKRGHKELCALPDFPGMDLGRPGAAGVRDSHAGLQAWLTAQAEEPKEDEVHIC